LLADLADLADKFVFAGLFCSLILADFADNEHLPITDY